MRELVDHGTLAFFAYYDKMGKKIASYGEQYEDKGEIKITKDHIPASISYADFMELDIHYEMASYPDKTMLIEAKQRRITAAAKRKRA